MSFAAQPVSNAARRTFIFSLLRSCVGLRVSCAFPSPVGAERRVGSEAAALRCASALRGDTARRSPRKACRSSASSCAHASHIFRSRTCFSRQPFTAAAGHSAQLCSRCPFRVLRLQ